MPVLWPRPKRTARGLVAARTAAPVLGAVSQAAVPVPGSPFSVVATADGRWSFVTLNSAVEVLSNRSPAPVADRQVSVPGTPQGEQLTNDGRYLLVADGSGAVVIDVARAEDGAAGAVLGTLSSPAGQGAVEVAVSPDDRFAFVTLELSDSLAVFDLHKALASGFGPADFAGTVPLGTAPVGLAVSPDGRWIYAASESARGAATAQAAGTVTVIGLRQAETRPADAVAGTVPAGCSPVRVQVGEAPVGLALSGDGQRLVVADSDRFSAKGATANLAVVNVRAAMAGQRSSA